MSTTEKQYKLEIRLKEKITEEYEVFKSYGMLDTLKSKIEHNIDLNHQSFLVTSDSWDNIKMKEWISGQMYEKCRLCYFMLRTFEDELKNFKEEPKTSFGSGVRNKERERFDSFFE